MKITMFGHRAFSSRAGGIDVVVTQLSRCMAAKGHQILCYDRCKAPEGTAVLPGIRVKRVPGIKGKGLSAVSTAFFAALCSGFSGTEVVHIHGEGPAFFCFLPLWMGKRVVVTIHGLDWQREKWQHSFGRVFLRWGEKMAARYAHEVIVLSRQMQQYFMTVYGRETVFLPNGMEEIMPEKPHLIRQQYGLEKDGYVLFVGRLVPEKGVHHLIQAYRKVPTDKKLVIAGAASDSRAYGEHLQQLAAGDGRIVFTGFVQGQLLRELYTNAYFYVLPSQVEGMPLSLLEAIGYGCCCLVSDIPACTQVLGGHGFAVPAGDADALESEIRRLCREPETVASSRGKELFHPNWEEIAEKTLELYR